MVRPSKALRIYAAEGYAPGELLARVDVAMLDGTLRQAFATAVCATFDPDALTLDYASAGHPAPLLIRVQTPAFVDTPWEAVSSSTNAQALPSRPGSSGHAATVQLSPGDSVRFFTGGLIERRHRTIDDGLAELWAVCATARSAERTLGEIVDTVTATFPTEDDVCVVRLSVSENVVLDPDATRPTSTSVGHT